MVRFEYPAGKYAVVIKDDFAQNSVYWNIFIKNDARTNKNIVVNYTEIEAINDKGLLFSKDTPINIYKMTEIEKDYYVKAKKLKTVKLSAAQKVFVSLASGPYLFAVSQNKREYGMAKYTGNTTHNKITIKVSDATKVNNEKKYNNNRADNATAMAKRLQGYILLQVESLGQAWYVDPKTRQRFYMKDGATAYEMMRKFGLGITNADLEKIPLGIDDRFEEMDYDADGLPDQMEEALGTDMYYEDSDNDGYMDGEEVLHGYNPLGVGKLLIDQALVQRLKGNIVLQVEALGEAWYIHPVNGRRYYMKDGDSAYQILRFLSLGITNNDLMEIDEGILVE